VGGSIVPFQNLLPPALFDCFGERTRSITDARAPSAGATAELWKGAILGGGRQEGYQRGRRIGWVVDGGERDKARGALGFAEEVKQHVDAGGAQRLLLQPPHDRDCVGGEREEGVCVHECLCEVRQREPPQRCPTAPPATPTRWRLCRCVCVRERGRDWTTKATAKAGGGTASLAEERRVKQHVHPRCIDGLHTIEKERGEAKRREPPPQGRT
jgi:hypothetical protein